MRAVIPTIIVQIANGNRKIQLGAITPTRDFNYVSDTVSGYISVMESNKGLGEVINLGSNFEISIKDAVYTIAEVMGAEVKIISKTSRLRPERSEVQRLFASNKKAYDLFNWAPKYAGLDGFKKGVLKTLSGFRIKKISNYLNQNDTLYE